MFTKRKSKCHKERLVDLPPEVFGTGTQAGLSFSRGFHVKLHGLVKIKISMLASITGEYEIADHKESPGLQQPRWPWGLPKPLVSPAGRIVIPKLLRGPFLTFIIHCNETKALRRKTTKKNIVTVFGQDPTMTRLDTTVCNHALF